MMHLFVKITAVVAVAIVALIVLAFVLKIVLVAALVAALVIGGLAIARLFRRRPAAMVRYEPPTYDARRYR
jgi:tetrahydromethanopterin S-methyltransferase subunit E